MKKKKAILWGVAVFSIIATTGVIFLNHALKKLSSNDIDGVEV